MTAKRLVACIAVSLPFLVACDGGSGSSQTRNVANEKPADQPTQAADYDMPPLVDVIAPSPDFPAACENIVLPDDPAPHPAEEEINTGGNTGFLVDSAVSGIPYTSKGIQSLTGSDGAFHYQTGETVRFQLGGTLLGEVTGKAQVSPFDLADTEVITGMPAILAALEDEDHPFQAVINLAVLLQSLDQDANPDNSIEVTPAIVALFQDQTLDLLQHWQTFPGEIGLRQAIAQANANALFSTSHAELNPAMAIQHLYATLGIDAGTIGLSREQYDEDGDGTAEDNHSWQYDINGNVTRIENTGSDGRIRGLQRWTYDDRGNKTYYELEEYGQSSREILQYDTLGKLTSRQSDEDGDGINEIEETWRYTYGVNGELNRVFREDSPATDDSTQGAVAVYNYNEAGKLLQVQSSGDGLDRMAEILGIPPVEYLGLARTYTVTPKYDVEGVLTGDVRVAYNAEIGRNTVNAQYDAQGNVTHYTGSIEQFDPYVKNDSRASYRYEYDDNHHITRKASDLDDDGKPDQVERYQYDTRGNVTRELIDWDGNGSTDQITTYEYDSYNNVILVEHDWDADGTVDESESRPYQYELDEQGNVVRRVLDQSGDGRPNEVVNYAYHADGSLAQEDFWTAEDMEHNVRSWQYNELGKLTLEVFDHGANGSVDSSVSFEHDACSYPTRKTMSDEEGNVSSTESWQHDIAGHLRRYDWHVSEFWLDNEDNLPPPFDDWNSRGFEGWQYDDREQLIRYQLDCQGDCLTSYLESLDGRVENYEYDGNGNKTRALIDRDNDGSADQVLVYEYDASNNLTRELVDQDGDGDADRVTSHQFNNNSQVTQREYDEDGDGLPDAVESFEYDQYGNLTLESFDGDADGTVDARITFKHEYGANGNLVRSQEETDWGANGKADDISYREYDAEGNLVRYAEDQEADGVLDSVETWLYDTRGKLMRRESDWTGDGLPEQVRTYQYDDEGRLSRATEAEDWNEDGSPDQVYTRHYQPTGWGHIFDTDRGPLALPD